MGSGHSTPFNPSPSLSEESRTVRGNEESTASTAATQSSTPHPKKSHGLTGMALIEHKCRKKKRAWGSCVKEHYEQKFLPGKSLEPEEADCDDLFEKYRQCYMRGLLKLRQEKGMAPPKEGTMLHEFMEEEGMLDTDTEKK
jgi:Uncharacterised protein family (UPF0203)